MSRNVEHVIITVHGIRTFGAWQTRLEKLVKRVDPGVAFHNFQYGFFSVLGFIFPPTRWLLTSRFQRELLAIVDRYPSYRRLDIVGHSFGTHLIAWSLHRLRHDTRVKVHTVILSGSVLRSDFYWPNLIPSRVSRVVNDCGVRDNVLLLSQFCVLFTGMAGRTGFVGMIGPEFVNRYSNFRHSGYFEDESGQPTDEFMQKNWLPLLTSEENPQILDVRLRPTAWSGFLIWLTNNFEPIKLGVVAAMLGIPLAIVTALYLNAEATKDRMQTVVQLTNRMVVERALTPQTEALLSTIKESLSRTLKRTPVLWVDDTPKNNEQEREDLGKFGLCFALAKNTDEALSFIRANPTVFPVIISDFDRPADNDNAHKLIQRLKDSGNAIPVIIYALNFTDKQAEHSVKVIKARAQLKYPLDLLAEVIKLVPPDTLKPSRSETILQAMLGCKFIWKQP
jgi:CheY-like chemotaxis protein